MSRTFATQEEVHAITQFLYHEARLLDEWRLREWLDLLTPDCTYTVPSTDKPDGDPRRDLFLILDERDRIEGRVARLLGGDAHSEVPRSRTRRIISNVLVEPDDGGYAVRANFVVYRARSERVDQYIGEYRYRLVGPLDELRIARRTAVLSFETLEPAGGKVSVIV